jgi:lipoprotein signal peptidase
LSEPTPTTAATSSELPAEPPPPPPPAAEAPPLPAAAAGPAIEGDRLAAPLGATRVVADYGRPSPSYVFLALVSVLSLAADVASKTWAERHLDSYPGTVEVWKNHVTLLLAKNRGGAWGLLQSTSENVRRPFFLLVSVAAIAFIMTLYRRLQPKQRALKWGLPLVLGGALGNVFDRIRYGHVIDFIDCHTLYKGIDKHWPTFNIADVAICVGVGLMAIDMFAAKRGPRPVLHSSPIAPAQSGEPSVDFDGAAEHDDDPPPPAEGATPAAAADPSAAAPAAEPAPETKAE